MLDIGAAADIEKVGRLAAVVFDEVHRAHGEAGPIDEAADRAVELHVGEPGGGGSRLGRLLLALVAEGSDILVAEQGVVVEGHLRVEGDHGAVLREDKRIDLEE